MRSIIRKSQFKKDFKKLRSSNRGINILKHAIQALAAGDEMPASFRDHALSAIIGIAGNATWPETGY
jgi:mRNA-degrading endonuclease YafQ of YafQ-DinJ toxin-antitoxin module